MTNTNTTILGIKLTEESGELLVDTVFNPVCLSLVDSTRNSVGDWDIEFDKPIFNSDAPTRTHKVQALHNITIGQTSQTTININITENDGTPVDGFLSHYYVEVIL